MLKRILELFAGVLIVIIVLARCGDATNASKPLITYIFTNKALTVIVNIALLVLAARLISGKQKKTNRKEDHPT